LTGKKGGHNEKKGIECIGFMELVQKAWQRIHKNGKYLCLAVDFWLCIYISLVLYAFEKLYAYDGSV
jgi:hypothetical protein